MSISRSNSRDKRIASGAAIAVAGCSGGVVSALAESEGRRQWRWALTQEWCGIGPRSEDPPLEADTRSATDGSCAERSSGRSARSRLRKPVLARLGAGKSHGSTSVWKVEGGKKRGLTWHFSNSSCKRPSSFLTFSSWPVRATATSPARQPQQAFCSAATATTQSAQ